MAVRHISYRRSVVEEIKISRRWGAGAGRTDVGLRARAAALLSYSGAPPVALLQHFTCVL